MKELEEVDNSVTSLYQKIYDKAKELSIKEGEGFDKLLQGNHPRTNKETYIAERMDRHIISMIELAGIK